MTRDEVIALARETGLIEFESLSWNPEAQSPNPESLAAVWRLCELVATAEREAIWNLIYEYAGRDDLSDSDQSLLKYIADAIRARGNDEP